jgi:hypothetical protein
VLLHAGPCGGALRYLSVKQAAAGHLHCRGATYVPDPRDSNWPPKQPYTTERWVPNWQAANISAGHAPKPARNVGGAWMRLMRVFVHTGPQSVRKTRRATARMDRLAYKVRRKR